MDKLEDNLEKLIHAICKELPNISDGKTVYRISSALKFYTDKILEDALARKDDLDEERNSLYKVFYKFRDA